jgi:hypothetical protein
MVAKFYVGEMPLKCHDGEMSYLRNIILAKCNVGELYCKLRNVMLAKCHVGEL